MCATKMEEIDERIVDYLTKVARNKLVSKNGRKLKEDVSEYIKLIVHILKMGLPWRFIKVLNRKIHYTTVFKFFTRMIKCDIFSITYRRVISRYKELKGLDSFENLFTVDRRSPVITGDQEPLRHTTCWTKSLRSLISDNRLGNKITTIVDEHGVPMCCCLSKANIMDSTLTQPTVDDLEVPHHVNLIADKGYISLANKTILSRKNIDLIYPYRKNQKQKNTDSELKLLKKRYIVENFFAWLKQFRRIRSRYDKQIECYKNFVLFGLIFVAFRRISEFIPEIFD